MKIPSVPAAPFEKNFLGNQVNLRCFGASTGLPEEETTLTEKQALGKRLRQAYLKRDQKERYEAALAMPHCRTKQV